MARLCVRIAPNEHPSEASLNARRTQVGDVVIIVNDAHQFSQAEMTNGQYRILDLPGVPESELAHLMGMTVDAANQIVARRVVTLDETALKSPTWEGKTTATKAELDAITKGKS